MKILIYQKTVEPQVLDLKNYVKVRYSKSKRLTEANICHHHDPQRR